MKTGNDWVSTAKKRESPAMWRGGVQDTHMDRQKNRASNTQCFHQKKVPKERVKKTQREKLQKKRTECFPEKAFWWKIILPSDLANAGDNAFERGILVKVISRYQRHKTQKCLLLG